MFLRQKNTENYNKVTLTLRDRGLFNKDIPKIVETLNQNSSITKLDLSLNNLDDGCVDSLCDLQHVTTLDLSINNINKGVLKLVQRFTSLNLCQNFISEETAQVLAKSRIRYSELNLKNNELSKDVLAEINLKIDKSTKPNANNPPATCRDSLLNRA
jgi:hypothetical protein